MGHRQEPGLGAANRRQPRSLLRDLDEYVLHDVGGVVLGTGAPQGEAVKVDGRQVVELLKGIAPAGREILEDLPPTPASRSGRAVAFDWRRRQVVSHGIHTYSTREVGVFVRAPSRWS